MCGEMWCTLYGFIPVSPLSRVCDSETLSVSLSARRFFVVLTFEFEL